MNKNIIDIKKIKKIFFHNNKKIELFKNVNISLKSGELVALTGPSGSGKTSLLHIIALLDQQTDGEISLMGKNVSQLNDNQKDLIRRNNISIIFQNNNLLSDFTALENVSLPLIIRGESKNNAKSKAEILLKKINLQKRMHHFPNELSGGEQQRVAIARAIISETNLILADEPTGNLDYKTSQEVFSFFIKLKKMKKTVIFATHNRELANKADYKLRISDGNIKRGNGS
jgi:ABC-type lipoprotein export system ATPase subunit